MQLRYFTVLCKRPHTGTFCHCVSGQTCLHNEILFEVWSIAQVITHSTILINAQLIFHVSRPRRNIWRRLPLHTLTQSELAVSLLPCVPGCFSSPASAQSALMLPCSKARRDWWKKNQIQTHSCMTIMSLCRTDRISLSHLNDLLQGESVSGTWQCYYVTCDCATTTGLQLAFFILLAIDVQPAWGSTIKTGSSVVNINEYFRKYSWMSSLCHIPRLVKVFRKRPFLQAKSRSERNVFASKADFVKRQGSNYHGCRSKVFDPFGFQHA